MQATPKLLFRPIHLIPELRALKHNHLLISGKVRFPPCEPSKSQKALEKPGWLFGRKYPKLCVYCHHIFTRFGNKITNRIVFIETIKA
jgi:hypothetical protein